MRIALLLVSFVFLAYVFAQGNAKNKNELDGSVQEINKVISGEAIRKRKAQRMSKKNRKKKKINRNKKKGRKGKKNKGIQNGKKRAIKQKSKKIDKRRRNKKRRNKKRRNTKNTKRKTKNQKQKGNTNKRKKKKLNGKIYQDGKKKNRMKTQATRQGSQTCQNDAILIQKGEKETQMGNIKRQSRRATNQHRVIGNKCSKAISFTINAKRLRDAINRAGGRENCKVSETEITETLTKLDGCPTELCDICISPLNSTWQEKYALCLNLSQEILKDLKDATKTCDDIEAVNAKATLTYNDCTGPVGSIQDVLRPCKVKNTECKTSMEKAQDIAADCKAAVDLLGDPSVEDETQDNRTSIVETSLDTFNNGTGDLLNKLKLSSGEGDDGKLSADIMAVVDNITRTNTISENPTCDDLISYSVGLTDFSASAEQQYTLSAEQTDTSQSTLGTINNLVSTGAAETALNECNTRQDQPYVSIFRFIMWQCYDFFNNYLRRSRCRRLARLCLSWGEPWCSWYCNKCQIPTLTGGIWWWEPVFTYEWYPVDPCTDRNRCIFRCPQCPTESTEIQTLGQTTADPTTSGAMSTAQGKRAKFFKSFLKNSKKIKIN